MDFRKLIICRNKLRSWKRKLKPHQVNGLFQAFNFEILPFSFAEKAERHCSLNLKKLRLHTFFGPSKGSFSASFYTNQLNLENKWTFPQKQFPKRNKVRFINYRLIVLGMKIFEFVEQPLTNIVQISSPVDETDRCMIYPEANKWMKILAFCGFFFLPVFSGISKRTVRHTPQFAPTDHSLRTIRSGRSEARSPVPIRYNFQLFEHFSSSLKRPVVFEKL